MASFTQKLPELGFIQSGRQPLAPDTSTAQAISTLGSAAVQFKKGIDKAQEAEDAAQANVVVNAFEKELIDDGKQNIAGFDQPVEEFDAVLNADDITVVNEARDAANRIDNMAKQGKSADAIQLERITTYQKFVTENPHLSPELRGFFKKSTGKGVLQALIDVEKNVATQAREELEAEKETWIDFSITNNMYDANESHQQRVSRMTPIMDEINKLQSSKRQLDALKTDREVSHEKRRAAQETAFRSGFSGFVVAADMSISKLLAEANFDPDAATAEDRQTLIKMINNRKAANELEIRDAGDAMDTTFLDKRINIVNAQYDNALDFVSGVKTKELYQNGNLIRVAASTQNLLEIPGMADKMSVLEKFNGLNANLLGFKERARFGTEVVLPIAKALLVTIDQPSIDAYPELKSVAPVEEQVKFYNQLSDVATKNLDNVEVQGDLANILEAYTNNWSSAPDQAPTGIYDKMMQVSSQPGFMEVLDKGINLNANFLDGIQEYSTRLQEKMASDMGAALTVRVPVGVLKATPQSKNFFQYIFGVPSVDPLNTSDVPKLFELVDVVPQKDGSLIFRPTQGASKLPKVRQLARDVTRKYGKRIGELVRSLAHTQQRDTDYKGAYESLIKRQSFGELTRALSIKSGADLTPREPTVGVRREPTVTQNPIPAIKATVETKIKQLTSAETTEEEADRLRVEIDEESPFMIPFLDSFQQRAGKRRRLKELEK